MRLNRMDTIKADEERDRTHDDGSDTVARYMRDVGGRKRLGRDEEIALVREMIARREKIADLLRAVLLKACDTLALDTVDGSRHCATAKRRRPARPVEAYLAELPKLREADSTDARQTMTLRMSIARLADKTRLRGLETKIAAIATFARGAASRRVAAKARRVLADIVASFGVSAQDIDRVAAAIAENRRLIHEAKQRLVENNLRLVVYFARRTRWNGADVADLVQEGNIALLKAVESFDPDRGLAFGTFASIGVCRAIQQCGATAAKLVRVPDEVRLRRHRVQMTADYLSENDGGTPSLDTVAEFLEVSKEKVAEAFEESGGTISFDSRIDGAGPLIDTLADEGVVDVTDALAAVEEARSVLSEIEKLDDRRRRLIESRYGVLGGGGSSLAEIGEEFGVTRERVRQLEARALRQLRTNGSEGANRRHKVHVRPRRSPAF